MAAGVLLSCGSAAKPLPAAPRVGEAPSVSSAPVNEAPPLKPFVEIATELVDGLRTGKNAEVRATFDAAMMEAVPNDAAVGGVWAQMEGNLGEFKRVMGTREMDQGPHHVVLVTCEFERSPMDVKVIFDADRKVGGIRLVAPSSDAFGPRPQHPKPPFPYEAREVQFDNHLDHSHFAGTLTLPQGAGPFPAVLLITGSGTQDRDETIFGHKPFLVIADKLTRSGIAVLRVDDPGSGGSTGDLENATLETHATDVEAGVAFLAAQKEVDPKRIGLVGHSEGGILAAMVASRSKAVAFLVSLAGTGVSGAEIIPAQVEAGLRGEGKLNEATIQLAVAAQKSILKAVVSGDDAAIDVAVKKALEDLKGIDKEGQTRIEAQAASGLATLKSPWFRSFVKLDPATYWRRVTQPVLVMNGDKDTQVDARINLPVIQAALTKANNKDFESATLAGDNHLFQPAKTGLVEEYGKIETTFDPAALDRLTEWLKKRAQVP